MNWKQMHEALIAPFPDEEISWKPGVFRKDKTAAIPLAHLNARAVMDRLDAVVGPDSWSDEYEVVSLTVRRYNKSVNGYEPIEEFGVLCRLTVNGVTKSDVGVPSDYESMKGAYSDALKRAAVKFGIGRYLYKMPSNMWVAWDDRKKAWAAPLPKEHWKLAGVTAEWKPSEELYELPSAAQMDFEREDDWTEIAETVAAAIEGIADDNGMVTMRQIAESLANSGFYKDENEVAKKMRTLKDADELPWMDAVNVHGDTALDTEKAVELASFLVGMSIIKI